MRYWLGTSHDFLLPNLAQNTESTIGAHSTWPGCECEAQLRWTPGHLHGEGVGGDGEDGLVRVGDTSLGQDQGHGSLQTDGYPLQERLRVDSE